MLDNNWQDAGSCRFQCIEWNYDTCSVPMNFVRKSTGDGKRRGTNSIDEEDRDKSRPLGRARFAGTMNLSLDELCR